MYLKRVLLTLVCVAVLFLIYYTLFTESYVSNQLLLSPTQNINPSKYKLFSNVTTTTATISTKYTEDYIYVWCIFSKVYKNAPLKGKFHVFLQSLLSHSTTPVYLNVLSDSKSKLIAQSIIKNIVIELGIIHFKYKFYDINKAASQIRDIVKAMMPHFSSQPGTYYSDALFYISLGLHRIAPLYQRKAIMVDCDIKFVSDVQELYDQFLTFPPKALFGLAPELTPVYRHVLYNYRLHNKNSTFGDYLLTLPLAGGNETVTKGFPGYNSGVVLFHLDRIREMNKDYTKLISSDNVNYLTTKYYFKGHLGDQDFYTLLGFEYPDLIHRLPCVFNRQLCTWWRDHGYSDVFDLYFKCNGDVKIYHGNCNTPIPKTFYYYTIDDNV